MATQLKNLKFGDYALKGETNSDGGTNYKLGGSDALTYEYTDQGVAQEDPIIDRSWSLGCATVWHFYGGADYAARTRMVEVEENGAVSSKGQFGVKIPTFSTSGSSATVDELGDWIKAFVNKFTGGSTHVITGTYNP